MSFSESDDAVSCWSIEGALPTPLHAAAVNGNKQLLQSLLQEGEKKLINRGDQFGRTPLVYSVLGDRLECAGVLLKAGAIVGSCDVDGRTPLHWAAYQGNLKCVKLLLSKGASWKAKDNEGRTPLHFSTSHQSSKCLSLLLKRVPKGEVDEPDNDHMTSLHWSASYGNAEHVKLLLKAGADVKLTDAENKTPLHWGATNPDPAVAKLLLDSNIDIINLQDNEGRTALHLSVARQNEALVKVLISMDKCNVSLQDNVNRSPLHWAAVLGNPQLVRLLLQKNAEFKAADNNGATALHYAAQSNFSKTVKVFLSFERVEDVADNEGRTALMWAAGKGAENALKTMLEHGLDVHTKDKTGGTALHAAAYSGHVNCAKLLIEHGASVDAVDLLHHTPLYRACEMGHIEVVNNLIQNGTNVNVEDQDGRSPLHWASLGGHALICVNLIQQGLTPDGKDNLGRTPLQYAAYGGFVNCMTVLIEHEAYVNHQDKEGITALHWSCSSGHLEAVKLLLRHGAFPNFREADGERFTPLDYAIIGDHQDVAQFMIEQGALTINGIQDIAATTVQSCWRGYQVRRSFQNRKNLLMRHEQLKDMKKRATAAEQRRTRELSTVHSASDQAVDTQDKKGQSTSSVFKQEDDAHSKTFAQIDEGKRNSSIAVTERKNHVLNSGKEVSIAQQVSSRNSELNEENSFPSSNVNHLRLYIKNSLQDSHGKLEVISPISSVADMERQVSESLLDFENSKNDSSQGTDIVTITSRDQNENFEKNISKTELARRERQRLHGIRTKVNAAVVIQRWFRKHSSVKREYLAREAMMLDMRKEQEELNRDVAALTIQLAWRKHLRVEFESKHTAKTKKKNAKKRVLIASSCEPKKNEARARGRSVEQTSPSRRLKPNGTHMHRDALPNASSVKLINPRSSNKRRPGGAKAMPSAAAMSYNVAMDLYHPLGSRVGDSRAAMVTGDARVRPGSMKRTPSGWRHDADFAAALIGRKAGSASYRA